MILNKNDDFRFLCDKQYPVINLSHYQSEMCFSHKMQCKEL